MPRMQKMIAIAAAIIISSSLLVYTLRQPQVSGESSNFLAAQNVLKANCVSCHANFGMMSEADWIASKYIVAGNPEQSLLYRNLKVAGGKMPPNGNFSDQEAKYISGWIASLDMRDNPAPNSHSDEAKALGRFSEAQAVFGKNCASCHSTPVPAASPYRVGQTVPAFTAFRNENEFVVSGLVTPLGARRSWLYGALKNSQAHQSKAGKFSGLKREEEDALIVWMDELSH